MDQNDQETCVKMAQNGVENTTPPQVFNCPKEDVRGSQVTTTSGTSLATWNPISAFDLDSGATPAAFSMSLYGQTTSTQFPYGFTTVGFEFIDNVVPPQNIALCTFLVAIPVANDGNPPSVNCPGDVFVTIGSANTQGFASWDEPMATDDNNVVRRSWRSHAPNTLFPVGATEVTYQWIDPTNDNTPLVCTFTVTVSTSGTDNVVPSLTCPADFRTSSANPTWTVPTAADASGVQPVQGSHNPGAGIPVGFTTVTYNVNDNSGNRASCSFVISRSRYLPIGTTSVEYLFEDTVGKTTRCVFNVVVTVQGPCASAQCFNGGFCRVTGTTFTCQCATGFTGQFCQTTVSQCANVQCLNQGTCQDLGTTFICQCLTGFTGQFCQTTTSQCANVQCLNQGTCQDLGTTFICQCLTGFTGQFCQTTTSPCDSVTCFNGGACVVSGTSFTCQCATGFTGTFCQTAVVNPCASVTCFNGGACVVSGTSFTCQCATGFTGQFCQTTVSPCDSVTCFNGGACVVSGTSFTCQCATGFTGTFCQTAVVNPCASVTCFNGGACVVSGTSFTCQCATGFTGQFCQTTVSPCDGVTCFNGGACQVAGTTFTCQCATGFTGQFCQTTISPCDSVTCFNGGACVVSGTSFTCQCATGFTGTFCQTAVVNPCANINCQNGGACLVLGTTFTCQCATGFTGQFCQTTIDPCATVTCQNGGACLAVGTSFTCQCATGFTGQFCQTAMEELSIVCPVSRTVNAADSQNIVLAQPTVTGAVGAVTFTYFVVGPSGSLVPVNNQQLSTTAPSVTTIVTFVEDQSGRPSVLCSYMITTNAAISPCANINCQNGGACLVLGTSFTCQCATGFTGQFCQTAVSPCANINCQNGGACLVLGTTFTCQCATGFTGQFCQNTINTYIHVPVCCRAIDVTNGPVSAVQTIWWELFFLMFYLMRLFRLYLCAT
ncbi:fibropellin-1-like [Asterias rubens]|uniref:fibropellin-1-like n=1 Tax=Asterias rubens TaxID=7604 RepID=UPI001455BED4|nr:fibropellin-1-like [Asterias rubens]